MSPVVEMLYLRAGGDGWGPIDELARLAARLMEARLVVVDDRGEVSPLRKAASLLPPRRRPGRHLIVLAASPGLLAYTARFAHWRPGYETVTAWVIDSFWTDRISRFALRRGHFDQFFVTDKSLSEEWTQRTGTPTGWLPWGADVLAIGTVTGTRSIDLQRLGRQPPAWDDDNVTIRDGESLGLVVRGRPPMAATAVDNQAIVRAALMNAKFVLAFDNIINPTAYTHPTRSYVTGRWTGALAAGATVVGTAPHNAADVLWEGATIEISDTDRQRGLAVVADLVADWTPEVSRAHHLRARSRLDWRYRIRDLAASIGVPQSASLTKELAELAVTG